MTDLRPQETVDASHKAMGIPPARDDVSLNAESLTLRILSRGIGLALLGVFTFLALRFFQSNSSDDALDLIRETLSNPTFWAAVGVGLLAQAIDGALVMAYGVTASTFLLATGASPAMASGATHLAEVFTTGVSGIAHQRLGNVDKRLFFSLLIPGVIGGLIGTYVLTNVDGKVLKPIVSAYLLIMGLYVLSKAFRSIRANRSLSTRRVSAVAVVGGFMDSTGGGGWGPIVTTTLVGAGANPKVTIGSVNYAEFFLTITVAAALFSVLDSSVWTLVSGLVVGGVFAAPIAAYATRHLSVKTLLILVGSLITLVSVYNIYRAL
jgi:uncharacterized membrane protein YfcA